MHPVLAHLLMRYPDLTDCAPAIQKAYDLLAHCFWNGGKLLVCGNGGSASDSGRIVGELMKGFSFPRPVPAKLREQLVEHFGAQGDYLANNLQGALPAISLVSQTALGAAFANDVAPEMIFAQQIYGYGRPGDAVLGVSTSDSARDVVYALQVGRALGMYTIGLTGPSGGVLEQACDVAVHAPGDTTAEIQERHLPIYHALCEMLEQTFFAP